jgi:hypothetical protein
MFFLLSFIFFFYKIGEQEGRTGSAQRRGWESGMGDVAQIIYTHVSKSKSNKIFKK